MLFFFIAASYVFRHDFYTSTTNSGHTIGLIRGRLWLAHLPSMNDATIEAWWGGGPPAARAIAPSPSDPGSTANP